MGISHYIKSIGRGKDGARPITREQATDLMGQLLDGQLSDLEIGAFCLAMRIKGETPEEMAGFLDAIHARLACVPASNTPTVVLPSYNGARKLPVLTPLLALTLAQQGLRVVMHGQVQDPGRITSYQVLQALAADSPAYREVIQFPESAAAITLSAGVVFLPTQLLNPALQRLLDVRRVVGLRNSAHSLVKLLTPCAGNSLLVSSYTHPEYLHSMSALLQLTGTHALLLRGTEGEPVADPRRTPRMDLFFQGADLAVQDQQEGSLAHMPELPPGTDLALTVQYTKQVLEVQLALPAPIACQVQHILSALQMPSAHTSEVRL